MRIRDSKLRNMAHTPCLSVFIAFKETNFLYFIVLSSPYVDADYI